MITIDQKATLKPIYYHQAEPADSRIPMPAGSIGDITYFQIDVVFPPPLADFATTEASDIELLNIAEKTGTFDFLNSPEEDIYNEDVP